MERHIPCCGQGQDGRFLLLERAGGKGFDTGPGDSLPGKKAFRVLLQQPGFRSFFAAYSKHEGG